MNKITLSPDENSYTIDFANKTVSTDIGTNEKYGKAVPKNSNSLDVQWTVGPAGYNYLAKANRAHELSGHVPFLIDLYLDTREIKEYKASIFPGSFGLKSVSGETYVLSCKLEVIE